MSRPKLRTCAENATVSFPNLVTPRAYKDGDDPEHILWQRNDHLKFRLRGVEIKVSRSDFLNGFCACWDVGLYFVGWQHFFISAGEKGLYFFKQVGAQF